MHFNTISPDVKKKKIQQKFYRILALEKFVLLCLYYALMKMELTLLLSPYNIILSPGAEDSIFS